jgi:hypothetical protein
MSVIAPPGQGSVGNDHAMATPLLSLTIIRAFRETGHRHRDDSAMRPRKRKDLAVTRGKARVDGPYHLRVAIET